MIIQPTCKILNLEKEYIQRTITTYTSTTSIVRANAFNECYQLTDVNLPNCTTVGNNAFTYCSSLTRAEFPSCTLVASSAFYGCIKLSVISFPICTTVQLAAFRGCSQLTAVNLPSCTTIQNQAFYGCYVLSTVSLSKCTSIGSSAFRNCYNLISLYLMGSSIPTLYLPSITFDSTPLSNYSASAGQFGSIYVPSSLLSSYKTTTGWSLFSSRFVGI